MLKKIILLVVTSIFLVGSLSVSMATEFSGNKRKGKYTYRKVYKACKARGEVDSEKPPISPSDKSQAQWSSIYEKQNYEEFGCLEEWDKLSDKDRLDIFTYLHAHASDSPTPAKCK